MTDDTAYVNELEEEPGDKPENDTEDIPDEDEKEGEGDDDEEEEDNDDYEYEYDEDLLDAAWKHYCDFLESKRIEAVVAESPEEILLPGPGEAIFSLPGDFAELRKILDLTNQYPTFIHPVNGEIYGMDDRSKLLPVLISVVCAILAENAIAKYFLNPDDPLHLRTMEECIGLALAKFPQNASVWVMAANFARMTARLTAQHIAAWYEHAAKCASQIRAAGLTLLEDESIHDSTKDWIELLLLNQCAGVERLPISKQLFSIGSEGDSVNVAGEAKPVAQSSSVTGSSSSTSNRDATCESDWGPSSVEATALFMGAMLPSIAGDHATALVRLKHFSVSHRLHPNMWKPPASSAETAEPSGSPSETASTSSGSTVEMGKNRPYTYEREGGLLPNVLYDALCRIFLPGSSFWTETASANGYVSFFVDLPRNAVPNNLMDDIVINYLLPLAQRHIQPDQSEQIVGYEWWVKSKATDDDLGADLGYEHESIIGHSPILSSILYLTGEGNAGSTVILNQTNESKQNADYGWTSKASDNSYLVFPGKMMRGTLPSHHPTSTQLAVTTLSKAQLLHVADLWKTPTDINPVSSTNNLTLMIGFWTVRVPDLIESPTLPYGPCAPLPEQARWVQELRIGYENMPGDVPRTVEPVIMEHPVKSAKVARVEPAWEEVDTATSSLVEAGNASSSQTSGYLQVPSNFTTSFFQKIAISEQDEDCHVPEQITGKGRETFS
jgi:hypothetical protein